METLVERYSTSLNKLTYNHHSIPTPSSQNRVKRYKPSHPCRHSSESPSPVVDVCRCSDVSLKIREMSSSGLSSEGDMSRERDYFDGVLKYIDQMLMEEEDVENKPCMFHECSALQAAEKSFYDVLGEKYPPCDYALDDFSGASSSQSSNSSTAVDNFVESSQIHDQGESESFLDQFSLVQSFASSSNICNISDHKQINYHVTPFSALGSSSKNQFVWQSRGDQEKVTYSISNDNYMNHRRLEPIEEDSKVVAMENHDSKGKRIHYQEDRDYLQEERSNKQLSEIYDKVLLCSDLNPGLHPESASHGRDFSNAWTKLQHNGRSKESNAGRPRGKKHGNRKEVVDLRSLLTQCSQAVASSEIRTADEILKRIRLHSSPYGDGTERLAHYFANAIEARLAGTGTALYTAFTKRRISAADILKAYQAYVTACPFQRMSNIFANKAIGKLARGATRLHIIDFGILYGFQWPCIIQALSLRPGGPPKLRITGIDLPQPGFRPAERVEETGRHLANYCKRFNVPFEYNAIAKKWDTIKPEDLKIDKDEMLVVNCLYRLRNVPDETVVENSPRDTVLNLIKSINPDMFIHGVLNGIYSAPFFVTRFREALFHFSCLFDMFEATALPEDKNRLLFEQEVFARDAMNVIACEGTTRIERPETYKQWQFRNLRAGFRQLPLQQDLLKEVSAKVRLQYHKDFVVDEDNNWMLQGWKGRVLYALSLWKPVQE